MTNHDYVLALRQARTATQRGDIEASERWLKLAERYLNVRRRKQEVDHPEIRSRRW